MTRYVHEKRRVCLTGRGGAELHMFSKEYLDLRLNWRKNQPITVIEVPLLVLAESICLNPRQPHSATAGFEDGSKLDAMVSR